MSYTREQRAAKAAAQANAASEAGRVLQAQRGTQAEASLEPGGDEMPQVDITPRNPMRESGMAMIEARMKREGELGAEPDAPEVAEPKENHIHPVVKKAEETPQPTEETPSSAETPPEPAPVEMVRVKVDGEEFDAPKDEVDEMGGVRAYQALKAQEKRLKATNDALAESKREREQMLSIMQQMRQPVAPPQPQVTPQEFLKQTMQKIRFGTDDEAQAGMVELLNKAIPQPVDAAQIQNQALMRFRMESAAERFKTDYADVMSMPLLAKMAGVRENELLQQGVPADWNKFYAGIGNELRSIMGKPNQLTIVPAAKTDSTSPAPADREARKASIVNLPTAAARAALPVEEPVLSPEQERKAALAAMNKARGKAY